MYTHKEHTCYNKGEIFTVGEPMVMMRLVGCVRKVEELCTLIVQQGSTSLKPLHPYFYEEGVAFLCHFLLVTLTHLPFLFFLLSSCAITDFPDLDEYHSYNHQGEEMEGGEREKCAKEK
jgi:hypothetical protein